MANNTWNFPCQTTKDKGPGNTRNDKGMVWEIGPGAARAPNPQPFSSSITCIFSFFIRKGWTSKDGGQQGIFSIGRNGATSSFLLLAFTESSTDPKLVVWFKGSDGTLVRYYIELGDEDGVSWLKDDKWYQVAVSADATSMHYVLNGSLTPTVNVVTNSPGSLDLDFGSERIWVHAPPAAWGTADPISITEWWPSLIMGPAAYSTTKIDLSSALVRNRIFDTNGDFKNPGENGSLWFGDAYNDLVPNYYFTDGTPRHQNGSDTEAWGVSDGGNSGANHAPGGLRKMYEQALPPFDPLAMTFDGTTGYYKDTSFTTAGNKISVVMRFSHGAFTGTDQIAVQMAKTQVIVQVVIHPDNDATPAKQGKARFLIVDNAGAVLCLLYATMVVTDSVERVVMFSFDGDLGTALLYVDGVDADDTGHASRIAPIAGTLDTGAGTAIGVGASQGGGNFYAGTISYFGTKDSYLTTPTDFMDGSTPLRIDKSGWKEWSGQPLIWEDKCELTQNEGSIGALVETGTITGPA